MNNFPSRAIVERIRKQYPIGTHIELVRMNDSYSKLKSGDKGTVFCIDDTGTIFAKWDNGERLGIVYGEDSCRKIDEVI